MPLTEPGVRLSLRTGLSVDVDAKRVALHTKLAPELSVVALGAGEPRDGARVRVTGEQ